MTETRKPKQDQEGACCGERQGHQGQRLITEARQGRKRWASDALIMMEPGLHNPHGFWTAVMVLVSWKRR